MKTLIFTTLLITSSIAVAEIRIDISEVESVELKSREIIFASKFQKFGLEQADGSLNLRKIPSFDNIELRNGMNISADQLINTQYGRMAEGGQDGGGG